MLERARESKDADAGFVHQVIAYAEFRRFNHALKIKIQKMLAAIR
jgi:hypothetical protein